MKHSGSPGERSDTGDVAGLPAYRCAHAAYVLRKYNPNDENAAIALWLRTWQIAYPHIVFANRVQWWRARWRNELVPNAEIIVAEDDGTMIGFITADPRTLYLDQIVVAPERWGSGIAADLIAEAKRLSPAGLDLDVNIDNARAIRFYIRQGFSIGCAGVNGISGRPVQRMSWRPIEAVQAS